MLLPLLVLAAGVSAPAAGIGIAPDGALRAREVVSLARDLGVRRVGWTVDLASWRPGDPETEALRTAGLEVVLTVAGDGPSWSAADGEALSAVLQGLRPVLLVVGGPEHPRLFRETGTVDPHLARLKAACAVSHAQGVPCTNGGLQPEELALGLWKHLRDAGRADRAAEVAARLLPGQGDRLTYGDERLDESLARVAALLAGYRRAGVDAVNVRWSSGDAAAFSELLAYVKAASGLPVVSTWFGEGVSGDEASDLLRAATRGGVSTVLWTAGDLGGAARLTPAGQAVRATAGTRSPR